MELQNCRPDPSPTPDSASFEPFVKEQQIDAVVNAAITLNLKALVIILKMVVVSETYVRPLGFCLIKIGERKS